MKPDLIPLLCRIVAMALLIGPAAGGHGANVPERTRDGFRVPQPGTALEFPRDHGNHPDYKIEWWYLTGHLQAARDSEPAPRRFGFQATFFRFSERPPTGDSLPDPLATPAALDPDTLHMAHMALTDIDGARFHFEERMTREGWDAHARVGALDLRNGNWSLRMTDPERETMELAFSIEGGVAVNLTLTPEKPRVRFGEDGTSRKGADPESRSFYISFTRLGARGSIDLGSEALPVEGKAWMDHEIASNQLSDDLAGWDWTAIQLTDGSEIKAYILRREDGSPDPFSALIHIAADGTVRYFPADSFRWEPADYWTSPATGATYPIGIRLHLPEAGGLEHPVLRLVPLLEDQEIDGEVGGTAYWEGACRVEDPDGREVGMAYLELVGYDANLRQDLP